MNVTPHHPWKRTTGWLVIVLVLPVLWLFRECLLPAEVLFSNDGPLGLLVSQADTALNNFTGLWRPSNWVGSQELCAQPAFTSGLFVALGSPVLFAKCYAPLALIFLGLSAWFFTRRAGFHPAVGAVVAGAAAMSSNPLSYACWGLPPKAIALACTLAALGLLLGSSGSGWKGWLRVLLAGLCVGLNVIEGADVGAILSLYVAAFAVWQVFAEPGISASKTVQGGARLAIVAVCAAWIAAHSLSSLVGTQIKGVAGMQQDDASREKRWEFATFGSFPIIETPRLAIPGLFGYRMDSPGGSAYWGSVGSSDGTPQNRFSGSGEYVGVLVLLVGAFAFVTSLRKERSPFTATERRFVWFWAAIALGSLLLAYGKFAPFYSFFFSLPYASTIRFPMKFLHGMNLALWILFAYGLEALARTSFAADRPRRSHLGDQIKAWRSTAPNGEKAWIAISGALLALAVVGAAVYASRAPQLTRYLATIPFGQGEPATAAFSIGEVWIAVAFLAASVGVVALAVVGGFGGTRAKAGWILLGAILVIDLLRANAPWVKHYDYQVRYQSNAVIDLLKERPWEHRVTAFVHPRLGGGQLVYSPQEFPYFPYLHKEWLEHHFQYYNIQSLDIDQMPRTPEMEAAYLAAFTPPNFGLASQLAAIGPQMDRLAPEQAVQVRAMIPAARTNLFLVTRLWELSNTRYQLGISSGIDAFNDLFDPVQKRFRVKLPYTLGLKPGQPPPSPSLPVADAVQLITAMPSEKGPLAVLEFTGALPRAKIYTRWETVTNDTAMLDRLRSPAFDPARSVVLAADPSGIGAASDAAPGEVGFASYAPKHVVLKTKSTAPGVLLLNDRWHPDWHVTVDGAPAELLRANFLMRGVAVTAGEHTVEFRFAPPSGTLWVSLSAIIAGLGCTGLLVVSRSKER